MTKEEIHDRIVDDGGSTITPMAGQTVDVEKFRSVPAGETSWERSRQ
jgi:hypothetical protein